MAEASLKPRKLFITIEEALGKVDFPDYLIEDLIPKGNNLVGLYGESGSGKSAIGLEMFLSIAMGYSFNNKKVKRGRVLYLTTEGYRDALFRSIAWCETHGVDVSELNENYRILNLEEYGNDQIDLDLQFENLKQRIREMVEETGAFDIVCFDTMQRFIGTKDESDNTEAKVIIDNCMELQREFDCNVWLVHHTPKSNNMEWRGASAFKGAMDLMLCVTREENLGSIRTMTITKAKASVEGHVCDYTINDHELSLVNPKTGKAIHAATVNVLRNGENETPEQKAFIKGREKFVASYLTAVCNNGVVRYEEGSGYILDRERLRVYIQSYNFGKGPTNQNTARQALSRFVEDLENYKLAKPIMARVGQYATRWELRTDWPQWFGIKAVIVNAERELKDEEAQRAKEEAEAKEARDAEAVQELGLETTTQRDLSENPTKGKRQRKPKK